MNQAKIEELRQEIREMTNQTMLYKMLKEELSTLGYWKNRERGNPRKGYNNSQVAQMNSQIRIKV